MTREGAIGRWERLQRCLRGSCKSAAIQLPESSPALTPPFGPIQWSHCPVVTLAGLLAPVAAKSLMRSFSCSYRFDSIKRTFRVKPSIPQTRSG